MKKDSKKKAKTPAGSEAPSEQQPLSFASFLGIGLLAGAIFNIPAILKVPRTGADWLMLTIVLAMAVVGAILVFAHPKRDE